MCEDIILITAHCPSNEKIEKLRRLVNQLQGLKNEFDIMVVSHTTIPLDIQDNVDICLYDKKNELLTEWDLINQPWFNPGDDRRIQSGLLTGRNTHLAIWRMLILGFSIAKNINYKKAHHIEYDCIINNFDDFKKNSKDLDKFNTIYYVDNKGTTVDEILFGSFQSYNLDFIHKDLVNLDEDNIKNMIRNSPSKSPEKMLQNLIHETNNYLVKDKLLLEKNGNIFATSENDNGFNPWGVPFVDLLDNQIKFIIWNQKKENGVKYSVIVNDEKIYNSEKVKFNHWIMLTLGVYNDINKITIIEDDEIRNVFNIKTEEDKLRFKKLSFRENYKR